MPSRKADRLLDILEMNSYRVYLLTGLIKSNFVMA